MKDIMEKLLKRVESTDDRVREINKDLPTMRQLVDSHSISIKKLEQQMSQLSATFNQRKSGNLLSDTVQNPRIYWSCMDIITRSDNMLSSPCLGASSHIDEVEVDEEMVDESPVVPEELGGLEKKGTKVEQPSKSKQVSNVDQGKDKEVEVAPARNQNSPPLFQQRLKKKADEVNFSKFMDMLK